MSDARNYTRTDCERFVRHLGYWTYHNPTDAVKRRDPVDYVLVLKQLIAVNKTRYDSVGIWETKAAIDELRRLSDEDPVLRTLILADRPLRLHDRRAKGISSLPGSAPV